MARNPTNTKGILALLRGISGEACETLEESGGRITTDCEVKIRGKYLTDKDGNVTVAVEASVPTDPFEIVTVAKAKTGWTRRKKIDYDGHLEITWKLGRGQVEMKKVEDYTSTHTPPRVTTTERRDS